MVKCWDVIDIDCVGVWGYLGGGSLMFNLLFCYGDKYKVGIVLVLVFDICLYDIIY